MRCRFWLFFQTVCLSTRRSRSWPKHQNRCAIPSSRRPAKRFAPERWTRWKKEWNRRYSWPRVCPYWRWHASTVSSRHIKLATRNRSSWAALSRASSGWQCSKSPFQPFHRYRHIHKTANIPTRSPFSVAALRGDVLFGWRFGLPLSPGRSRYPFIWSFICSSDITSGVVFHECGTARQWYRCRFDTI